MPSRKSRDFSHGMDRKDKEKIQPVELLTIFIKGRYEIWEWTMICWRVSKP